MPYASGAVWHCRFGDPYMQTEAGPLANEPSESVPGETSVT
jgi:hypothetical protein